LKRKTNRLSDPFSTNSGQKPAGGILTIIAFQVKINFPRIQNFHLFFEKIGPHKTRKSHCTSFSALYASGCYFLYGAQKKTGQPKPPRPVC